ncbi:putative membrane protein [Campylobacter blaseri]|uniref:Uncharacterized protein n=1 Tax=Campylobacter blaseri TaxID=2042961 RepID=A0A2P8R014_9BACT|nr:hypothetical protein [Campylobacter blaseri]PSM51839.1 hypothetical protein CQ405_06860 [Campylobacter blaseri]PSM53630.1 hypothetical protein CRN67_06865 [Campylobacter blaseri]QKF86445.1 putative membrane protein [Campylobacter blaseri]
MLKKLEYYIVSFVAVFVNCFLMYWLSQKLTLYIDVPYREQLIYAKLIFTTTIPFLFIASYLFKFRYVCMFMAILSVLAVKL